MTFLVLLPKKTGFKSEKGAFLILRQERWAGNMGGEHGSMMGRTKDGKIGGNKIYVVIWH